MNIFPAVLGQYKVEPASQGGDSHHNLETVEASSFSSLHFSRESFNKVFIDDTIRSSEECEDVRDEVPLVVVEAMVPVPVVV